MIVALVITNIMPVSKSGTARGKNGERKQKMKLDGDPVGPQETGSEIRE